MRLRAATLYLVAALISLICTVGLLHRHEDRSEAATCAVCSLQARTPDVPRDCIRSLAAGSRPPLVVTAKVAVESVQPVPTGFLPIAVRVALDCVEAVVHGQSLVPCTRGPPALI